jgi:hypothetical protein
VRFECGAVVIANGHVEMLPSLTAVASQLDATVSEHGVPLFTADRLTLPQLLRRAFASLPNTVEVFSRSTDFATSTQCVVLETSADVTSSSGLARSLGYPHLLPPIDVLEQVACGARDLVESPSDQLLVNALAHYMQQDAFLEAAGEP